MREFFRESDAVIELYDKICKNALVIVCRLIMNRESDEEFMAKEKHAEILYQNYLISVPMIFDMIALYGCSNKDLIQKIISGILKIEPKYLNDLKAGMKYIQSTFSTMKKQVATIEEENRNLFERYEDLCLYLMNTAVTLNILIELLPLDVKIYCSRDLHLEQSIASLYDNLIPTLFQHSKAVDSSAWFLNFISYARVELINTFRDLLNRGILALFSASDKTRNKIADEVLSIFTECAGFHTFIKDYTMLYPIEIDLDVIQQSGKKM
jgi:activating signal cointegrator complex subunit 2